MEKFISSLADRDLTMKYLSADNGMARSLHALAREFCHVFNTKVGFLPRRDPNAEVPYRLKARIPLFTAENMPCGSLSVEEHAKDVIYMYSSPLVCKEKASARSDRETRDSSTIKGLINAIKRNKEAPDGAELLRDKERGIRVALETTQAHDSSPRISVDAVVVTELVKQYVNNSGDLDPFKDSLHEAYNNWCERVKAAAEINKIHDRFAEGCKGIGILMYSGFKPIYIVADLKFNDVEGARHQVTEFNNVSIVNSLADDARVAADAMMIRTYIQGQEKWRQRPDDDNLNDFHIRHVDRYFSDIDVAVGYYRHDNMWVLIPNRGE